MMVTSFIHSKSDCHTMAVSIVSEKYECDGRVRNPKPNTVKGMTVIPYISETRDTMVVSVNQSLIPLRA